MFTDLPGYGDSTKTVHRTTVRVIRAKERNSQECYVNMTQEGRPVDEASEIGREILAWLDAGKIIEDMPQE